MSMEDPGEPGTRPATPAWPTSAGSARSDDAASAEPGTDDTAPDAGDEDPQQFDWDSWQPDHAGDDGHRAEEVDWDSYALDTEPPEPASWREKVIGESDWARDVLLGDLESLEPLPSSAISAPEVLDREDDVPASLSRPLPASGPPWPPPGSVSHDVIHVRLAPWAPFTTGVALAIAMVLVSAAILTQTGRLGLTLSVLTGQVPTTADAVVGAYLSAISRGDSAKALSYLATRPTNPLLLTDAALRTSSAHSPLTVVRVKAGGSTLNGT
ncbi:MAG: hypothetical protein ACYC1E_18385, partial [Propionibacteriaceae bacterium]